VLEKTIEIFSFHQKSLLPRFAFLFLLLFVAVVALQHQIVKNIAVAICLLF
jgi:hypothetical protein